MKQPVSKTVCPKPQTDFTIDDDKTKQLATKMKYSWAGSTEDGYTEAINTFNQLGLKTEEALSNYGYLMDSAKESAKKQVEYLIQSATKDEVKISVEFKEEAT